MSLADEIRGMYGCSRGAFGIRVRYSVGLWRRPDCRQRGGRSEESEEAASTLRR